MTDNSAENEKVAMLEIVPYDSLEGAVREMVDSSVHAIRQMSYHDIMQLGWDFQETKNSLVKEAIFEYREHSLQAVDDTMDDISHSQKSIVPRPRFLFIKPYQPTNEHRQRFVGKIGNLEDLLNGEIEKILESNENIFLIVKESKDLVDRYALVIMAIDKCLSETTDPAMRKTLEQKREELLGTRLYNIQSAVMYMKLYQNNVALVNQIQRVIHIQLPQLQDQVLIQTGVSEIKTALKQFKDIRETIDLLGKNNISELNLTGKDLSSISNDEMSVQDQKEMEELISSLSSMPLGAGSDSSMTLSSLNGLSPKKYHQIDLVEEEQGFNYKLPDGTYLSETYFSKATPFTKEGLALVENKEELKNFIKTDGKMLFKKWLVRADPFQEGYALVAEIPNHCYFINAKGEHLGTETFIDGRGFVENFAAVKRLNGCWNFYSKQGSYLCNTDYVTVNDFSEQRAVVQFEEGFGECFTFINQEGKEICTTHFLKAKDFYQGLAEVFYFGADGVETHRNYLRSNGELVCPKFNWDIEPFDSYGFARVSRLNGIRWNLLNKKGNLAFEGWVHKVGDSHDGLRLLYKDNSYNCFDEVSQNIIWKGDWFYYLSIENGKIIVKKYAGKSWKILNRDGTLEDGEEEVSYK